MTRLILLTNEYPHAHGDAVFVAPEVEALAEAFDEVVVFSSTDNHAPLVPLPPGVRYAGNLRGGGFRAVLRGVRSPERRRIARDVTRRERSAGRLRGFWRENLLACIFAMRIAGDPRLRRELDADAVVYSFWGMGAGLAVPWLAPHAKAVAVRLHSFDLYEEARHLPFRTSLFDATDAVLAVSRHGADYLRHRYPQLDGRLHVRRIGTPDYGPAPKPAPYGSARPIEVVSVSRVIPRKRVELILTAVAELSGTHPVRWRHVGDGPGAAALAHHAAEAVAIRPHLTVDLVGHVSHADALRLYREGSVDVLVNASTVEGVPVSIMEALALGIPVVATNAGGTSEIVGLEHASGILLPVDADGRAIADAILDIVAAEPGALDPRRVWEARCDAHETSAAVVELLGSLRQTVEDVAPHGALPIE